MNLQEIYQSKLMTPDEAVERFIQSGAVLAADIALAHAPSLYEAIGRAIEAGKINNITQHTLLDTGAFPCYRPEFAGKYLGVSWFTQANARKAINAGYGDVMPGYYRDIPGLFRDYVKPEIMVATVSPMDKHGYFSTGCDGSISAALLSTAKIILLEVNEHMPRALSAPQIHVSQVSALWENNKPLMVLPPPKLDDISITIGNYIAEEIPNGATLQLGIGAIPDAVGNALQSKHNLGIHTEMFTDSMMTLIECGAVDNSAKRIHTGKTVAAFALGTQRMYDYIDDNPMVEMLPVDYVNDPYVIAQHDNFISINAALEVDFYGQVCAESIGYRHLSGTGGQADYVRGAIQSKGGKSFIAFASTAKDDTISRIMPVLSSGAQVSTHKNDVDRIVTEYGIAKLRGKTLSQRTKALIAIAHPKFRDMLTFEAKKENIII